MRLRAALRLSPTLILTFGVATPGGAQVLDSTAVEPAPSPLPDRWAVTGVAAASLAAMLLDDDIRDGALLGPLQGSPFAERLADGASHLGGWGPLAVTTSLSVVGAALGAEWIADPAGHASGAILMATAFTFVLKGTLGRTRPTEGEDAVLAFRLGRGFHAGRVHRSFPSGHTTTAFALASALSAEWGHWRGDDAPWVRWVLYSAATLTGLSRIYHDQHWASDVILGAGIGWSVGRGVVRWRHAATSGGGIEIRGGPQGSLAAGVRLPLAD